MPWKTGNIVDFFDILLHFNCACSLMYLVIPNKVIQLCELIGWSLENIKLNNHDIKINYQDLNKKVIAFEKIEK